MIPYLEQLETRLSPAAIIDPVFVAGVAHFEQSLLSLYSGIQQSISQAQALGITPPAGTTQTMKEFGAFVIALPQQMFAAYQQATPQQIAAIDLLFIQSGLA